MQPRIPAALALPQPRGASRALQQHCRASKDDHSQGFMQPTLDSTIIIGVVAMLLPQPSLLLQRAARTASQPSTSWYCSSVIAWLSGTANLLCTSWYCSPVIAWLPGTANLLLHGTAAHSSTPTFRPIFYSSTTTCRPVFYYYMQPGQPGFGGSAAHASICVILPANAATAWYCQPSISRYCSPVFSYNAATPHSNALKLFQETLQLTPGSLGRQSE